MRFTAFSALVLGLGLSGVQLSACSNSADDCNATASCGAAAPSAGTSGKSGVGGSVNEAGTESGGGSSSNTGGSSGTSGSTGGGGDSGGGACKGDVSDDAACWTTNEYGVFVSSDHGVDATGDGTKEAPYATITKAIGAAAGKKVYVCLGSKPDYVEKISLSKDFGDGVHIYGGFDCESWEYSSTRKASVKSPENIALRIQEVKQGVYIENLRFTSADGTGEGLAASSYGAFVTGSKGVLLRRVEITAGNGADGAAGKDGVKGANAPMAGEAQTGEPGLCEGPATPDGLPGRWSAPVCGRSKGGNGGGGFAQTDGSRGASGIPDADVTPPGVKNFGVGATAAGAEGGAGANGSPGNSGLLGPEVTASGTFSPNGYIAVDGKPGTDGFPGQGGGGGGASKGTPDCRGASGGAGGMGGCGGTAGGGGRGGGASVGFASFSSDVTLENCTVTSGVGGAGGRGGNGGGIGLGEVGGAGGASDEAGTVGPGGQGGRGGNGGIGGSGSGGAGGPSLALVFSGARPTYNEAETKLVTGLGGEPGAGGRVNDSAPQAPSCAKGQVSSELEIK